MSLFDKIKKKMNKITIVYKLIYISLIIFTIFNHIVDTPLLMDSLESVTIINDDSTTTYTNEEVETNVLERKPSLIKDWVIWRISGKETRKLISFKEWRKLSILNKRPNLDVELKDFKKNPLNYITNNRESRILENQNMLNNPNNKFYVYNERVSSVEVNWFNNRGYAVYNNRLVKSKSMPSLKN